MEETMKAMAVTGRGVEMIEVPKPVPGPGDVRVKVIASAVNPAEQIVIDGKLVGRFLHAKASPLVLGWDFAGTTDALGEGVTDLEAPRPRPPMTEPRKSSSGSTFVPSSACPHRDRRKLL
jgi:NADPH:quinone reductase-like Zn-dependent oxidoreductase